MMIHMELREYIVYIISRRLQTVVGCVYQKFGLCEVMTELWLKAEAHILSAGCNFMVTEMMKSITNAPVLVRNINWLELSLKCTLTF